MKLSAISRIERLRHKPFIDGVSLVEYKDIEKSKLYRNIPRLSIPELSSELQTHIEVK